MSEPRVEKRPDIEIAHVYGCPRCGKDHRSVTFSRVPDGAGHQWSGFCGTWGEWFQIKSVHTEEGLV